MSQAHRPGTGPRLPRPRSFPHAGVRAPLIWGRSPLPRGGGSPATGRGHTWTRLKSQASDLRRALPRRGLSFAPRNPWSLPRGRRPLLLSHGPRRGGPRPSRGVRRGRAAGLGVRAGRRRHLAALAAVRVLLVAAGRELRGGQVAAPPAPGAQDGGRRVPGGRPGPGALLPDAAVHRVSREDAGPRAPRLVPPHRRHRAAGRAAAAEHDAPGERAGPGSRASAGPARRPFLSPLFASAAGPGRERARGDHHERGV